MTPQCPRPAVGGRGRCSRHGPASAKDRGSTYGYQWQRLRAQAEATLPKVCALCGHPITRSAHLDHITPVSLGGQASSLADVQWTHEHCNISKGGRNRLRHVKVRRI